MNRFLLCILPAIMIASCKKSNKEGGSLVNIIPDSTASLVVLKEADYRPLYHFTPPQKWMNDPNGLVYYKGKYHLFYQYHPNSSVWGPMHWGHASSTDLFNWRDEAVALAPDHSGAIFSGSAVVDTANTSGFKTGSEDPMVAVYTLAGTQQHQAVAYSNDGGTNWTKYALNPVLPNPGVPDFRDPKVFWHSGRQKWVMALAAGKKINFYSSADLKAWAFESSFGENRGAQGGVWECPDLFELPVEGTNTSKWVLLVSINPGGPNGGSATQYFVGDFDGKTFTARNGDVLWLDYGTDNYAGITYNNIPSADGRRILIGWMSNWNYAQQVPTTSWRSTMTVPRVLSLASTGQGYVVRSLPVKELSDYTVNRPDTSVPGATKSIEAPGNRIIQSGSYEISFSADLNASASLLLTLGNLKEKLTLGYDKGKGLLTIDRSASGRVDFNGMFPQKIVCPYVPKPGQLTDFQILVDKTSVEVFADKGEKVLTALFFPVYQYTFLKLQGDGAAVAISNFRLQGIGKSFR